MRQDILDVITYSGSKGDERPLTFNLRGLRIDVLEITERWIEESVRDRTRRRFFRLRGSDGNVHTIYFDELAREWHYAGRAKRRT